LLFLRVISSGVAIFCQHILGDIISPPIIGALSDSTGSLQTALQCTWIALFVSAAWWLAGWYFLEPLKVEEKATHDMTYRGILCDDDPLIEVEGRVRRRHGDGDGVNDRPGNTEATAIEGEVEMI
jgi:hypothetical protein